MSEVVKRLRDRRLNVYEQAMALANAASEENREFSAEEEGQWQQLNAELDALDSRIKNMLDGEQRAKDTEDAFAKLQGKPVERGQEPASQTESELRAFLRGEGPRAMTFGGDGPVSFRDLIKVGPGVDPDTAGGYTVPTSFFSRLVAHLIEVSGVLQAQPTVLNTASGENIQIPKTTAHSTASIVTEGTAIGEDDPVFGQITLGSFKYGNMTQLSRELLTDTGVDLEGYLAMQTGRALGNALGDHLVNGTGTGQPRGVITDSSQGVEGATGAGGKFTADDLIDLFFSVIAPYRMSASCMWLMRDATIAEVRKLKTAEGQFLWQPGLQAGVPDLILGKPVVTDPFVPAIALGAKSVVFGDFSQYFVRTVNGIRFERSDDFAFGSDLVSFRGLYRADGALVDLTGAVKHFVGGAT